MTRRTQWPLRIFAAAITAGNLALMGAAPAEDNAQQHYDKAQSLRAKGDLSAAIRELQDALRLEPNNATIAFDLAYAMQAAGRYDDAAGMFEKALQLDPAKYRAVEDRAYALKAAGRNAEAEAEFRKVIDNRARYPQETEAEKTALNERMERVRREIGYMSRDWYAGAFFVYRSRDTAGAWSPTQDNGFSASMAGAEAGWRPLDSAKLEAFARGFLSFARDSLDYNDRSLQFGVGLRWRPIETQDLALSVERLIKAGDDARDAWLLRASYGWNSGGEWNAGRRDWNFTSLYGDIAYIPGDNHYFSLYGEATQGWRFAIAPGWALTPHATLAATYTDDIYASRHLIEGGPGLMLTRWYGGDAYHAAMSQISLAVQYRAVLDDNVGADNAWVVKLVWGL